MTHGVRCILSQWRGRDVMANSGADKEFNRVVWLPLESGKFQDISTISSNQDITCGLPPLHKDNGR